MAKAKKAAKKPAKKKAAKKSPAKKSAAKKSSSRKKSAARRGKTITTVKFANKKFNCHGKKVKTKKRGKAKSPRVFCYVPKK